MEHLTPIVCRELSAEDYEILKEFLSVSSSKSGIESDTDGAQDQLRQELLGTSQIKRLYFGVFRGPVLVATLSAILWDKMPSATLCGMRTTKGALKGKEILLVIGLLYKAVMTGIESRGYNKFYLLTTDKRLDVLVYLAKKLPDIFGRYAIAVEEVVAPNSQPRFEMVWNIMGRRTWPKTLILRSGTLLNRYRNYDRTRVGDFASDFWDLNGTP